MSTGSDCQSGGSDVSLHELYRQADAEWKTFLEIPGGEVRAYCAADPRPAGRVQESFDRQAALRKQMEAHPDSRDFEADLRAAIGRQLLADDDLAREAYASMTNSTWTHEKGDRFGAGFRGAGGIVAEIRNLERGSDEEDYLTWYCSSPEGVCTERMAEAMAPFGWTWSDDDVES